MNTQRFFIELSYNGTPYHGWQIQPNAITVQECLDKALSVFFRQTVSTLGCGRTDTGVHATQFYAHFDLELAAMLNIESAVAGINSLLPYDIAVQRIFKVMNTAHARFDATERTYQYHIHFHKNPFKQNRSWLYKGKLDAAAMNGAAQVLLKYKDFSCFSKSNTQTFTNNCNITFAGIATTDGGLVFTIKADRFLRNMVRAIVGTLINAGKGEIDLKQFAEIIEKKNRNNAGQSVPACGLYLTNVIYPFIP